MATDQNVWKQLSEKLNSPDPKIRAVAIEELAQHDEIQSIRLLLRALTDLSAQNRQQAGQILIQRKHPAVVSGLTALLDSEKFHVRTTAMDLLEQLPGDIARKHIQALLEDPSLEHSLRTSLIGLYCHHAEESMIPAINRYLAESSEAVRKACMTGLNHALGEWVTGYLTTLMQSDDMVVSQEAVQCLMRRPSTELIKYLVPYLRIPGKPGDQALSILSRVCSGNDYDIIETNISTPDPLIRRRILLLLSSMDANRALLIALRSISDDDEGIRSTAEDLITSRPPDVLVDVLLNNPELPQPIPAIIRTHLDQQVDDQNAIELIESGRTDAMDLLLRSRDFDKFSKILAERLDPHNSDVFRNQIALIGRMGRRNLPEGISPAEIPDKLKPYFGQATAEIELRESLKTAGINPDPYSLKEICNKAIKKGWTEPDSMDRMLETQFNSRNILGQQKKLQDNLAHYEKQQMELQPFIDQIADRTARSDLRGRLKLFLRLLLVISAASSVFCLMKNMKSADGAWYLGFFISVCMIAATVFTLRSLSRQSRTTGSFNHSKRSSESIAQQANKLQDAISATQKELSAIDEQLNASKSAEYLEKFRSMSNYLRGDE
ncbi:hypothetical protein JW823_04425 [bacterium]|nr:hypothetical protein [candidate division CSSED10-310 bacterium]